MDQELMQRLDNKEDNFVERKPEGAGSGDFKKTLVAFANSVPEDRTAVLFIGISNSGEKIGVKNTDSLQKSIRSICEKDCYPPITFQCEVLKVDNKEILAVIIPHSINRPYFAGPAYVRIGSESVIANEKVFEELIDSRTSKVAEILKRKNEIVTVMACGKKLGNTKPLNSNQYRTRHDCKIEECNSHYLRMQDISTGTMYCEPLSNVDLNYDEKRYRLMIIVHP